MCMHRLKRHHKEKVIARVGELIDLSHTTQGIIIPPPKILYRLRGCETAGLANFNDWTVDFNPCLLTRYEDEYLTETVAHEIAHFVAVTAAKTRKRFEHGQEWQRTMRSYGLRPRINHNYTL